MAQLKRRQRLLNVALGTLFALGIEFAMVGVGRLLYYLACVSVGVAVSLGVAWFTDARTGFFSGVLAWAALSFGWRLLPHLHRWLSSSQASDEGDLPEPWTRIVS